MDASAKMAADLTEKTVKIAETGLKKAWAILDAASEKQAPSEYLSSQAIQSIQGKTGG